MYNSTMVSATVHIALGEVEDGAGSLLSVCRGLLIDSIMNRIFL